MKLIGDTVMFVTPAATDAIEIALDLLTALGAHPVLPDARAAVANGLVTMHDGDYFGPVVNLAARLVQVGEPGGAVVPAALAAQLDECRFDIGPATTHALRGFAEPVDVRTVALDDRLVALLLLRLGGGVVAGAGAAVAGGGGATTCVSAPNAASSTQVGPGAA